MEKKMETYLNLSSMLRAAALRGDLREAEELHERLLDEAEKGVTNVDV